MARRDAAGVRLITRNGNDFTKRSLTIAAAIETLSVRSCLVDGEAIVCDKDGLAVFELIRRRRSSHADAILCAFDVLELNGDDMRKLPIERRKIVLAKLLGRAPPAGIVLNAHYEADGAAVFKHACALGCEGIVSKRLGSTYRSARTDQWLKIKNPAPPAAHRVAEEDWS